MTNTLKGTLTRARDDAEEAARYLAHTRNELAILLEQAAGREHTRAKIKELLAHVIAAGIKAEQVTGHTQTAAEWLGDTIEPARLYFSRDIARKAGVAS